MKRILLSLSVLLFSNFCFSQGFELEWSKVYGGSNYDFPEDMKKTADGGYIILGNSGSYDGDVSNNPFDSPSIWLIKLDADYHLEWEKSLGYFSEHAFGKSIDPTSDGGYIISAHNFDLENASLVLKLDQDANLIWSKDLPYFGGADNIQQTSDNGYILTNTVHIIKLDENGEIEWSKHINNNALVKQVSDGGYLVGMLGYESDNAVIYKLSLSGEIHWQINEIDTGILDCIETSDGNYLFTGYKDQDEGPNATDYFAMETTPDGEIVWKRMYGGSWADMAKEIIEMPDGGYVISGVSQSFDGDISQPHGNEGEFDNWLVKIDSNGNLLCEKSFGGSLTEGLYNALYGQGIAKTPDDGILLTIGSESSDFDVPENRGNYDYWVYKVNLNGCENMATTEVNTQSVAIYPNPFSDHIKVESKGNFIKKLQVLDLSGKLIKEEKNISAKNNFEFNLSDIKQGIYILKVETNNELQTFKIVKK